MAKSGTDKYSTTVVLTAKCGKKISAALFQKKFRDDGYSSMEKFLEANESKILNKRFGKQQKNKFFPNKDKGISPEEWDLQIYCFLLLEICRLDNTEYKAIEYLRKKRNKLSHRSDPALNDDQYEKYTSKITNIIKELLPIIDDKQLEEEVMQDLETALRSGTSEFQDEFVKILHNWYSDMDVRFADLECSISGVGEGLKSDQKITMNRLEYVISLLEGKDGTPVKIPGTEIEILVKNCSSEKERVICSVLASLFNERIRNEASLKEDLAGLSEQTIENLRTVVADVFQDLVSKGIKLSGADQKCILLKVNCTSFKVLMDLVNGCADRKMTFHFQRIENALKKISGYEDCLLQEVITENEFWKCMEKIVSEVEERSQLISRNTSKTTDGVTVQAHSAAESLRFQHIDECVQTDSESKSFRSPMKKLETAIQREFDLPTLHLERKVIRKVTVIDEQSNRRQHKLVDIDDQTENIEILKSSKLQKNGGEKLLERKRGKCASSFKRWMTPREVIALHVCKQDVRFDIDPVIVASALLKHNWLTKEVHGDVMNMFHLGYEREHISDFLIRHLPSNVNLHYFVRVLAARGYKKIAIQLLLTFKTGRIDVVHRAECGHKPSIHKVRTYLKNMVRDTHFDPHLLLRKVSNKFLDKMTSEVNPDRIQLLADACSIIISTEICITFPRLPDMDVFKRLYYLVPATSNASVSSTVYYCLLMCTHLLAGSFHKSESMFADARCWTISIQSCLELVDMLYIEISVILWKFEQNPTKALQNQLIMLGNVAWEYLEGEDFEIKVFWRQKLLLKMVFCVLRIGTNGNIIKNHPIDNDSMCKATSFLEYLDRSMDSMEGRRKMLYYVAKARSYEVQNNLDKSFSHLTAAFKLAKRFNCKQLVNVEKYFECVKWKQLNHAYRTFEKYQPCYILL